MKSALEIWTVNPRTFVVDTLAFEALTRRTEWQEEEATRGRCAQVINGQLNGRADLDWFRFAGTAGQRLLIDGNARRIDSRSDVVLTVLTSDGGFWPRIGRTTQVTL